MGWQDGKPVAQQASSGGWRSGKAVEKPATDAEPGELEALGRGIAQGATLGFGDEAWGGIRAVGDSLPTWLGGDDRKTGFMEHYRRNRDENRRGNARAEAAHGNYYTAGEIGGGVGSLLIPGLNVAKGAKLAATVGKLALAGGIQGLGDSRAELTPDKVSLGSVGEATLDTGIGAGTGAGLGLAGHGLGKGIGWVGDKIVDLADTRLGKALAKAKELGKKKVEQVVGTGRSEAGRASTAAYKNPRNIMDAGAEKILDPAERATFDRLKSEMAESGRKGLLEDAAAKDAATAAYRELLENKEKMVAQETAEALKSTGRADARSMAKGYGEQLAGSVLGGVGGRKLDDALGTEDLGLFTALGTGAGLMTGRTRAGKALLDRLRKPGNQREMALALRRFGERLGGGEVLGKYVGAGAREATPRLSAREILLGPATAEDEEGPDPLASRRRR